MAGILGSGKTNAATAPRYTQMQLNSAVYGIAIPIIYGTTRGGWNLGDYVNFKQHQQASAGGKGGSNGGGGKGSGTTSLTYSASVLGFLAEGPIAGVASSWISQSQSAGTPGFTIFDGALAQSPWTYLEDNFPSHALSYSGFAYAAAQDYDLGSSANLPNVNWEVQGFFNTSTPSTYGGGGCVEGGDADPSLVIPDLLTNVQYGLGFPANRVGQVASRDESHSVPGSGPFTVTVTSAASYLFNINIARDSDGQLFTCVTGSPQSGLQYAYNATTGVYTFHSAAAGEAVHIRYASLNALVDYQAAAMACGLWISPAYTDQSQASSILDDIATATFAEVVWTSGVLTLVPRHSAEVSGNGFTYTPPSEPIFSLGPDDLMENNSPIGTVNSSSTGDPVIVSRSRTSDQVNDVKIECFDRANQYAPTVVEAQDHGLIDAYGRRPGASKSLHMFCDVNGGNTSAHLQLQDQYIRNNYSFQLDERYILLDPMDVVELTDPAYPGLTDIPVRILEIQENDDGTLSFSAEEYPGTIGVVPEFTLDAASGTIQDFNVDPGDAATPAIFDVPVQLAQKIGLESWLATHSATGNPNWGGCEIWLSSDDTTFTFAGQILGASRMGTLTASFASGSDPDTTHTLAVDLTESLGELVAGTTADADKGDTICFVDGEYVSYSAATLTSTFHYSMASYLRRGQCGSQISSHSSGSLFVRLDDNVFKLPYNATDVGRTIHVKLLSFNIYSAGLQSLSDVSSFAHTIGGPPTIYAPTSLTVIPTLKGNQLVWVNAPNVGIAAIEIWRSASSSFGGASKLADAGGYDTSFLDQNATSSATQYWYWIRCRDIAGKEGGFDPSSGGAGATGTTLQVQTADVADSAITTAKIAPGAVTDLAFAAGLAAVWIVSSLPGSAPDGQLAVLTTDGKLYRFVSGAWTRAVDGGDIIFDSIIAGTLSVGAVNAGAIVANDILVTGHLVANSVTAPSYATAGSQGINNSAYAFLAGINYTTDGGDVEVNINDYCEHSGGHSPTFNYQIYVDGSPYGSQFLSGGSPTSFYTPINDLTLVTGLSAANHDFDVYASVFGGDPSAISHKATIRITELKR